VNIAVWFKNRDKGGYGPLQYKAYRRDFRFVYIAEFAGEKDYVINRLHSPGGVMSGLC
jgi:hypothetical protein